MTDISLDDLRNLPDALGEWADKPPSAGYYSEEHHSGVPSVRLAVIHENGGADEVEPLMLDDAGVKRLISIITAARAFSRLVSVCTTCDGSGEIATGYNEEQTVFGRCLDCVDGLVVSPEAVERAAAALFTLIVEDMPVEPFGTYASDEQYRAQARVALRAALGLGGEG